MMSKKFSVSLILWITCLISSLHVSLANLPENYYKRAIASNDAEEKLQYFSVALKLDPKHPEALVGRAAIYFQMGQLKPAEQDLSVYFDNHPGSADSFTLQGAILQHYSKIKEAGEAYDNALKLEPNHSEANFRKGLLILLIAELRNNMAMYKEAKVYFEKVRETSEWFKMAHSQFARLSEIMDEFLVAQKAYANLARIYPEESGFLFNHARMLYMQDKIDLSRKTIQDCVMTSLDHGEQNTFYPVFQLYLNCLDTKDQTSSRYHLGRLKSRFQDPLLISLFLKEITPEDYEAKMVELGAAQYKGKRLKAFETEYLCALGYYYLMEDDLKHALQYFDMSKNHQLVGLDYYFLSVFEHKKINALLELRT